MQISTSTMLGSTKCMRPLVAPGARPQSRRSVMVAAHQRPHEGIMKAALVAAAAAQLTLTGPSLAVGHIGGIEPNRDRAEDYAARNAMDAAENKGPAVQGRDIFAPDVKGASKIQQGPRGSVGDTTTTSGFNERDTGSSKDLERAKNAVRNFPTAFSPYDLSALRVDVGAAGSTTAESGKQVGGGSERDAFDLKGPGSNQNRAREIQNLKPGKAVENVKEKIKSALPTANVYDPASLQVNVGQGGGDSAARKEELKNSGLIGGGGSSAAAQGPSEGQNPAQGAQNLAQQAQGLNPGKAVESIKDKVKSALPTANYFNPASLQVNVGQVSANPEADRRAQELKNSGITTGLPAPLAGDNAIPIKGTAVPNKDTSQGRRADDQAASKGNRIFPTSSVFDTRSLQVDVALFGKAKKAASTAQEAVQGTDLASTANEAAGKAQDAASSSDLIGKAKQVAGNVQDAVPDSGLINKAKQTAGNVQDVASGAGLVGKAKQAAGDIQDAAPEGLVGKAKQAAGNVQDAASGISLFGKAKQAAGDAQDVASELKGKAGAVADANGGDLVKELSNAKEKAPYVQPGPVRSTPDILNLDEPGKVIRENAGKLAGAVTGTSSPAMWGSDLQVNVGYGSAKEARPSDIEDGLSGAVKNIAPNQAKIAERSKAGDADAVASEFGPGEQSVKAGSDGTRPRSTETSDFRSGATDQSPEARFGAPTAIAKKISGQETL